MQAETKIDPRDWGLLLFLSVLWGGSYLFAGIAVRELPPLVIVLARVSIAALALLPLHGIFQGGLPKDARSWVSFTVMSALNNVIPFTLIVSGQALIASGLASVINATTPLFTVTILALFREEPLVARKMAGLVVGLAGVAVLRGAGLADMGQQALGMLLCLGAAASYGFAGLWAKQRLKGVAALTSATCQLLCSTIIMAPMVLVFSDASTILDASLVTWGALLGFALLSTALAYIVFFRIVARSGPSAVMLVTMLIPVSAILLGHVVLEEAVPLRQIIGALIIAAALLVIDGRLFRLLSRQA